MGRVRHETGAHAPNRCVNNIIMSKVCFAAVRHVVNISRKRRLQFLQNKLLKFIVNIAITLIPPNDRILLKIWCSDFMKNVGSYI